MNNSVFIPIPVSELRFEAEQPSKSYRLDLERGRILPLGSINGIEAIEQAIKKALMTPRFRCLIYDNQYGSELKQTIISEDNTQEFIETEIPRLVKDALSPDSRIRDVYGFSIAFDDEDVLINFTVLTDFGEIGIEGVL